MISSLRIALVLCLVLATTADQGFDLADAFGDDDPTPAPKPKPKDTGSDGSLDLDLLDALDELGGGGEEPAKPEKPKVPEPAPKDPLGPKGGDELDLFDALGPDDPPEPKKPVAPKPPISGGGGSFDDSLSDIAKEDSDYKPDPGKGGKKTAGGGAPYNDPNQGGGPADQPQEGGAGGIAGIASAIGVALLGMASSYFAYQKKKLCFKIQGGQDPEAGLEQHGTQSDPQVMSNLLEKS